MRVSVSPGIVGAGSDMCVPAFLVVGIGHGDGDVCDYPRKNNLINNKDG